MRNTRNSRLIWKAHGGHTVRYYDFAFGETSTSTVRLIRRVHQTINQTKRKANCNNNKKERKFLLSSFTTYDSFSIHTESDRFSLHDWARLGYIICNFTCPSIRERGREGVKKNHLIKQVLRVIFFHLIFSMIRMFHLYVRMFSPKLSDYWKETAKGWK